MQAGLKYVCMRCLQLESTGHSSECNFDACTIYICGKCVRRVVEGDFARVVGRVAFATGRQRRPFSLAQRL